MKNQVKRSPRPLGTTELAIAYHASPTEEIKEERRKKLIERFVDDWINTGGYTGGTRMETMFELSQRLGVTEEYIQKVFVSRIGLQNSLFDVTQQEQVKQITSGVIFRLYQNCLESKALSLYQTNVLLGQQNGQYVPFLTNAVNGALSNLIASNKPMLELAKMLQDSLAKIPETDPTKDTQQYLTAAEAHKLLNDRSHSILLNPELLQEREATLGALPDIHPMTQKPMEADPGIVRPRELKAQQMKGQPGPDEVLDAEELIG